MAVSIKLEAPPGTSLESLAKGYVLTHQTEGSSPHTVEYYQGALHRFLWYARKEGWPDDARLLTEWQIREFLGYVGTEVNRWGKSGNGSESSSRKASPRTVHHYYSALGPTTHIPSSPLKGEAKVRVKTSRPSNLTPLPKVKQPVLP